MKTKFIILMVIASAFSFLSELNAQFVTSYDGTVNVSPTSGALEYEYPLSNMTGDGYKVNVTLRYNSSMTFKRFSNDFNARSYKNTAQKTGPAWVIGVNGFAVQVLHQNSKPFCYDSEGKLVNNTTDETDGWMLEGYDYCNRMKQVVNRRNSENATDVIRLMRTDGSVLHLVNPVPYMYSTYGTVDQVDTNVFYTGYYYEGSGESRIYALVEYDDKYYYDSLRALAPQVNNVVKDSKFRPRVVHLFTGDGLEYTFYEIIDAYGLKVIKGNPGKEGRIPTIFYLEKIRNSIGTVATFERMYHNHKPNAPNIFRGRSPMTTIAGNHLTWSKDGLTIQNMQRTTFISFDRKYNLPAETLMLGDAALAEKNKAIFDSISNQDFGKAVSAEMGASLMKQNGDYCLMLIKEIVDPDNRKTSFRYTPALDRIINSSNVDPNSKAITFKLDTIIDPVRRYNFRYIREGQDIWGPIDYTLPVKINEYFTGDRNSTSESKGSIVRFDKNKISESKTIYTTSSYSVNKGEETLVSETILLQNYNNIDIDSDSDYPPCMYYDELEDQPYPYKTSDSIVCKDYIKNEVSKKELIYGMAINQAYFRNPDFPSTLTDEIITMPNGQVVNIHHSYETFEDDYAYPFSYVYSNGGSPSKILISRTTKTTIGSKTFSETVYLKDLPLDTLLNVSIPEVVFNDIVFRNADNGRLQQGLGFIPFNKSTAYIQKNVIHPRYYVPPVFDIPVKTISTVTNSTGTHVLGGKINKIADEFVLDNGAPRYRYGAIIEDSIITPEAKDTLLNTKYIYSGGWFRNFLVETENSLGVKNKLYYDYSEMADDFGGNPTGKVLKNDNSIETITLVQDRPEYESPIATETNVRKYYPDASGGVALGSVSLRTVNERTHHGQISNILDPNGWIANTTYDSIGRPLINRLPYDFPSKTFGRQAKINDVCRPIFDYKTIIETSIDTINRSDSSKNSYSKGTSTYDTIVGRMSIGNNTQKNEFSEYQNKTFVQKVSAKAEMLVLPPNNVNEYDELNLTLKLHFTNLGASECKIITIRVFDPYQCRTLLDGTPNLSQCKEYQFLVNCPELYNDSLGVRFDPEYMLKISKEYLDSVNNANHLPLRIQVELSSPSGYMDILTDAEDRIPTACFYKDDPIMPINDDFTTSTEYDDENLVVKSFAKIDDELHTSNPQWQRSVSGLDGRYTGGYTVTNFDGSNVWANAYIGNPFTSTQKASSRTYSEISNDSSFTFTSDPIGLVACTAMRGLKTINHIYDPDSKEIIASSNTVTDTVPSGDILINRLLPGFFDSVDQKGRRNRIPLEFDTNTVYETVIINGNPCRIPRTVIDTAKENYYYKVPVKNSTMKTTTGEDGKSSRSYYDAYGQLRLTVADLANPDSLYNVFVYDDMGNQIYSISHTNDTTKYWYDDYSRVTAKASKDAGIVTYRYNKFGQLRFSQTAEQNLNNKVSFYQYDDLGRATLAGEAAIDGSSAPANEESLTGTPSPLRIAAGLRTDSLNIGRPCLPTANPTLWETPAYPIPLLDTVSSYSDTVSADFYPYTQFADKAMFFTHWISFPEVNTDRTGANDFENVALHPNFVRSASQYDEMPPLAGAVWANMPLEKMKRAAATDGQFHNLLGRKAAIAYRDDETQAFRYAAFDYDARGRVTALVRFTDNIGFDAVYYKYNSANQIIQTVTSDAEKSNVVWYAYDDNGRLSKIWSRLHSPQTDGDNYGIGTPDSMYFPRNVVYKEPSGSPDITYSYDIRGNMVQATLDEADAIRYYRYSRRGWLDSLIATRGNGIDTLFMEALERTPTGRLTRQTYTNAAAMGQRFHQSYQYGTKNQLTKWTLVDANDSIAHFEYSVDAKGNRTGSSERFFRGDCSDVKYTYSPANANRLIEAGSSMGWVKNYAYNANGAVIGIRSNDLEEQFAYYASGLTKSYTLEGCETNGVQIWDYQYSGVGGRESKRLTFKPKSIEQITEDGGAYAATLDGCISGKPHWTYYLRGAAGEEMALYSGMKNRDGSAVAMYLEQYSVGGEFSVAPDGKKWYFISDHQGNVRCKFDKDNTQFFDYTPYGAEINSNYNDPNGWISSERDFESKYMNLQARLYDPVIGRFLSVDPLFEMQLGINPYHYCFNDPVNYSDPWGLYGTGVFIYSGDNTSEGGRIFYEVKRSESVHVYASQQNAIENLNCKAFYMNQSGNESYDADFLLNPFKGSMKGGNGSGGGDGGINVPGQQEQSSSDNSGSKAVQAASSISDGLSVATTTVSSAMDYVRVYERIRGAAYLGRISTKIGKFGIATSLISVGVELAVTGRIKKSSQFVNGINTFGTIGCFCQPELSPFIGAIMIGVSIVDICGGWEWMNE